MGDPIRVTQLVLNESVTPLPEGARPRVKGRTEPLEVNVQLRRCSVSRETRFCGRDVAAQRLE